MQTNTIKNEVRDNFTIVANHVARDPNISWKAKGIFTYLAGRPKDWEFIRAEVEKNATDGRDALKSGLKELEDAGYLTKHAIRTKSGKFKGWNWQINHYPRSTTENPSDGKPDRRESRPSETPTDNTKKEYTKTDNTKKESKEVAPGEAESPPPDSDGKQAEIPVGTNAAEKLAQYLLDKQKQRNPNIPVVNKPPSKTSIEAIRLLITQDKVRPSQIKETIDFLMSTDSPRFQFHQTVTSGTKLRREYSEIQIKRNQINGAGKQKKSLVDIDELYRDIGVDN